MEFINVNDNNNVVELEVELEDDIFPDAPVVIPRNYKIGIEPTDSEYISRGICPDYALLSGMRANSKYWPRGYDFVDGPDGEPRPPTHRLSDKKMKVIRRRMSQYILSPDYYDAITKQTTVFIELDNVLADFNGAFNVVTGLDPLETPKHIVNHKISVDHPNFLKTIPKIEISYDHLWLHIRNLRPIILIKNSHLASVINDRIIWCEENLGNNKYTTPLKYCVIDNVSERNQYPDNVFYVMFVRESEKLKLSTCDSVLIDADESIADDWEREGGIFLPFKNEPIHIYDEIIGFIRNVLDVKF